MTNDTPRDDGEIEMLWRDLLEKDDRTSPAEYPNMALITFDEFSELAHRAHASSAERGDVDNMIARLRERITVESRYGDAYAGEFETIDNGVRNPDGEDAADMLAALSAENERLTQERDEARKFLATARKVIDDEWAKVCGPNMQRREADALERLAAAQSALASAEAREKELRDVLDKAARAARPYAHHALWQGLIPYGWSAETEAFGIGLANRIANAVREVVNSGLSRTAPKTDDETMKNSCDQEVPRSRRP